MTRYRVGRHLGRTIYDQDRLIGIMDTPELGALVAEALNARERVLAAPGRDRQPDAQVIIAHPGDLDQVPPGSMPLNPDVP
jgi:hypothetical protein